MNIDTVGPVISIWIPWQSRGWNSGPVTVLLSADYPPGVAMTQYRLTGSSTWSESIDNHFVVAAPADHSNDGANSFECRAIGNDDSIGPSATCTVKIDTTAPAVTDDASTGWSKTATTVTLSPFDGGSGVAKTQYRLAGSPAWLNTTANQFIVAAPADHSNDGVHSYQYQALDGVGNASATAACTVGIDTTGPSTAGKAARGKKGRAIILMYRIADKLSAKATAVTLTIRSPRGKLVKRFALGTRSTNAWLSVKWKPRAKGRYRYSITAKDLAGNKQTKASSATIKIK